MSNTAAIILTSLNDGNTATDSFMVQSFPPLSSPFGYTAPYFSSNANSNFRLSTSYPRQPTWLNNWDLNTPGGEVPLLFYYVFSGLSISKYPRSPVPQKQYPRSP